MRGRAGSVIAALLVTGYVVAGLTAVGLRAWLEPTIASRERKDPSKVWSEYWPEALFGWGLFWFLMVPSYAVWRGAVNLSYRSLTRLQAANAAHAELEAAEKAVEHLLS